VSPVLAHGGTAGAVAEALFLAVPVVVFLALSRWSKRKARALEAEGGVDEQGDADRRGTG
jgi:hypothetical protein